MLHRFVQKLIVGMSVVTQFFYAASMLLLVVLGGLILFALLKAAAPWERMFFTQGQRCMDYWDKNGLLDKSYSPPYDDSLIYIRYQTEPSQGRRSPKNFYHVCIFDGWSVDAQATNALIDSRVQSYVERCEKVSQGLRGRSPGRWKRWDPTYPATEEEKADWRARHCTAAKGRGKAELHPEILASSDRGNDVFD